jgi:succinate dehydrogenase/fumarate reductase flavoprotein subunit
MTNIVHVTGIYGAGCSISEAVITEGAIILNGENVRLTRGLPPYRSISHVIANEINSGK